MPPPHELAQHEQTFFIYFLQSNTYLWYQDLNEI